MMLQIENGERVEVNWIKFDTVFSFDKLRSQNHCFFLRGGHKCGFFLINIFLVLLCCLLTHAQK